MTDSDIPPPLLLPDEIHQAVRPGTALLRLETTHSRQGVLDGAWWPRTRHVEQEVPALVAALTEHLRPHHPGRSGRHRVGRDPDQAGHRRPGRPPRLLPPSATTPY